MILSILLILLCTFLLFAFAITEVHGEMIKYIINTAKGWIEEFRRNQ